jgi:hypothetical protein
MNNRRAAAHTGPPPLNLNLNLNRWRNYMKTKSTRGTYADLNDQRFEVAVQLQMIEMEKGIRHMRASPLNKKLQRLDAQCEKARHALMRSIHQTSAFLNGSADGE